MLRVEHKQCTCECPQLVHAKDTFEVDKRLNKPSTVSTIIICMIGVDASLMFTVSAIIMKCLSKVGIVQRLDVTVPVTSQSQSVT